MPLAVSKGNPPLYDGQKRIQGDCHAADALLYACSYGHHLCPQTLECAADKPVAYVVVGIPI